MATIKDIAKIAGVSVTTVSKVINDYPDISKKTKEKVRKIMQEENYRPNAIARSLSTNKSNSVGIFFTDHQNSGLSHLFFREVIYGVERAFSKEGFDLILFASRWGDKYSYVEKCRYRNVDGAILMGMPRTDPHLDNLTHSTIPTVFVDLDLIGKNATYVMSDNVIGAGQAVQYLAELGHQQIGMIMGQITTKPAQDRFQGFQQEMDRLGLKIHSEWLVEGDFSEEGGYRGMQEILQCAKYPTAIFCQSDEIAIGALHAIEEAGLKVPRDFSLMGFDDIELSRYIRPTLTTVHQDKYLMGQRAAELLLQIIENPKKSYAPIICPTKIVERESTCKRTTDD